MKFGTNGNTSFRAAEPLTEEEKSLVFNPEITSPDDLMLAYIAAFLKKNKMENFCLTSERRKKLIVSISFALVIFLDFVEMFVYHRHFVFNGIVAVAAIIAYVLLTKSMTIEKYLLKEVKLRPKDDIDPVLISQVSGASAADNGVALRITSIAAAVILPVIIFARPHIIYEKNETDGYSVRYYTASVFSDDDIVIPETHNGLPVNEIRGNVFENIKMKHITLPSSLTQIRAGTFQGCTALISIDIPENVEKIGSHAFYGCYALTDVTVPDGLKTIGSSAFRNCTSLKYFPLPEGARWSKNSFKGTPLYYRYN